jgi:heptosyltransferase-1
MRKGRFGVGYKAVQRILLVKTSSLGDVIHNLPVAGDIRAALPDAVIDWVVEESYAAIPRLHPAVARVLPVALRRWRYGFLGAAARAQIGAFARELRRESYDAVIDTQGLVKSALIARLARGTRHGLDFASAREPLSPFYDRVYPVPWSLHAVERNRALAAHALGYRVPARVDYGIAAPPATASWLPGGRYAVLAHATSSSSKLWALDRWVELGMRLEERGTRSVLPWGSAAEQARARDIAGRVPGAVVAPALSLPQMAAALAGAWAVIGVDTGLTHLACALGRPTVGIYCATDPGATGLYGGARAVNLGGKNAPPAVREVLDAMERISA